MRYVVFPVMWRQTGKSLVWLRTELRLRHIRNCPVSARTSLTVGPHAIDFLGITRSSVNFLAKSCAPPCLHCHDKLGISALLDCGTLTVTGQGVGGT